MTIYLYLRYISNSIKDVPNKVIQKGYTMKLSVFNKRSPFVVFIICIMVFSYVSTLAEEPFAPKITLPAKMENYDMWAKMVKDWKVPSEEAVGIPAYPGAFIIALVDSGSMESGDEKIVTLPVITLGIEDEQAKVVSFYKEKLKDWKYKNSFDMFDIFWTGRDDYDVRDIMQTATIPNLVISKSIRAEPNFMPKAKTTITIVYKPQQTDESE